MSRSFHWPHALSRLSWWLLSVPVSVKILGIGVLVGAVFCGMTLFYIHGTLSRNQYHLLGQRARSSGLWLSHALERPLITGDVLGVKRELDLARKTLDEVRYIVVRDPSGAVLAHTFLREVPVDIRNLVPQEVEPQGSLRAFRSREGNILEARYRILNGDAGFLQMGFSDRRIVMDLAALLRSALAALGISILISTGLGLLLTYLLTRPIQHLAQTAFRISQGDFNARSEPVYADEMGRLTVAFNEMAESLATYRLAVEEKEAARLSLLDQIVQAQESERKAISRELHDQLGQSLLAVMITVQSEPSFRQLPDRVREDLIARLRGVSDEVRRLAWGMRPSILDDYGLDMALSRFLRELAKPTGLEIDYQYSCPSKSERLPGRIEVTLYRIAQEAVTNIVRHAQARRASVVVLQQHQDVTMLVEDDGKGISSSADIGPHKLGLTGIRERTTLLGGVSTVESRPGGGTTVRIKIPLDRRA